MKLTRIDSRLFLLGEDCYLDSSDECYFANLYDSRCQPAIKPFIILLKQDNETAILAASCCERTRISTATRLDSAMHICSHAVLPGRQRFREDDCPKAATCRCPSLAGAEGKHSLFPPGMASDADPQKSFHAAQ